LKGRDKVSEVCGIKVAPKTVDKEIPVKDVNQIILIEILSLSTMSVRSDGVVIKVRVLAIITVSECGLFSR